MNIYEQGLLSYATAFIEFGTFTELLPEATDCTFVFISSQIKGLEFYFKKRERLKLKIHRKDLKYP